MGGSRNMVEAAPTCDFLAELFASYGLMPFGGFHPSPKDGVPGDPQTLLLVANAGPDMWNAYSQMPFNLPMRSTIGLNALSMQLRRQLVE